MKILLTAALALLFALPVHAQLAPHDDSGMTYGHVHLNVSDIELHKELWAEHFDGELVERGPLTVLKFPGMLVALSGRAPTGGSGGSVMNHLGFKVRDMQAVLDKWRAAGYEVDSEFTGAEGSPNAFVIAPDDIRIELQEDTEQRQDIIGYHIHFNTPDYVELLEWYVDIFGLVPYQRGTITTTANAPGLNLSFGGAPGPLAPTQGRAIDHIGFEVRDLAGYIRKLEARGITLDTPYREIPAIGLNIAYLTDPVGTRIELTEGYVDY